MAGRDLQTPDSSQNMSLQLSENDKKNKDFKSRIPRLVSSSVESGSDARRLPSGAEVMAVHEDDGGFVNPAYESIHSSSETRTARYHGKYSSYEEMLANMDDKDPFKTNSVPQNMKANDNPSFSRQQKQVPAKRSTLPSHHHKKKKQISPSEHDNPGTAIKDNVNTADQDYRDCAESDMKRRLSNVSTGTFVVRKGDSSNNLLNTAFVEKSLTNTMQKAADLDINCEDSEKAIAEFINEKKIKMRQCKRYISRDRPRTDCKCGRDKDWHVRNKVPPGKGTWSVDEHTETLQTNCFGSICFQGFGQDAEKAAPYIRIDKDTKPDVILTLLDDYWKMPKPKLIISVTGGAKRFFLKNRLKNSFKRGLINVAMTTGAWIVTGGTNIGVMEFVGEAVKEYTLSAGISHQKLVVLGITTWGIVDNKESLMPPEDEEEEIPLGLFPAYYNSKDLSTVAQKGICSLDNNHTHFILVDDGTEKKFGAEISFRAALENAISKLRTELSHDHKDTVPIPVVLLVLEGGVNTIQTVLEAVEKNIPAVIIQGSGRAADVIAFAVKYFRRIVNVDRPVIKFTPDAPSKKPVDEVHYLKITEKVETWLDWTHENANQKSNKVFQCVKNIESLLNKMELLTVFYLDDIDTTNEIDQAILHALLKARQSNIIDQLNLALAWNHCDIARQEIFSNENRQVWRSKTEELYEAMFTAMVQNKIDFVQLFLDNGVELKDFLTVRRLRELYDEIVNDQYSGTCSSLLLHLLQREQLKWQVCCCHQEEWQSDMPNLLALVGKLISSLTGDQYVGLYEGDKYLVEDEINDTKAKIEKTSTQEQTLISTARRRELAAKQDCAFPNPEKDLLFWAVLLNRKDLAHIFWKLGKDHIGGALTVSTIFKSLSHAADTEEELDLSTELIMNSEEFEELATGVLNECYQRDKHKSHILLIRSLDIWGDTTVMSIADNAERMTFMGHSCCQTKLNKIWKGKMALYTSMWKILLGLVFFPFIIPTIRFFAQDCNDPLSDGTLNNQMQHSGDYTTSNGLSKQKQKTTKLYRVGQNCSPGDGVQFFQAMYYFHTAPLVKFCYHTLSYVCFLGLFCFFLLTNMRHRQEGGPSAVEYVVWLWAATMLIEEFRQIAARDPNTFSSKLASYFSSLWNQFDITVYLLLILTVILRLVLPFQYFVWARRLYAITLTMFFLRFMQTYYVEKNMGPKVIMIKKMLTDLVFFVLILAVFVLGYGVAIQVLRFPNAELSWQILKNVVYIPYWNIYGELFLDELQSDVAPTCPSPDPSNPGCPEESWLVMILLALYMVFTNVLLLNLLIAMFSYTFERVQQNSEKVWRFHRYGLVYEFFDKPTLAPPLILFTHIFRLTKYFIHLCSKAGDNNQRKPSQAKQNSDFYQKLSDKANNILTAFERVGMENYLIHRNLLNQEHIQNKVTTTGERIEKVIEDLEQIKETVIAPSDVAKSPTILDESAELTTVRSVSLTYQENISGLQTQIGDLRSQVQQQHNQMQQVFDMISNIGNQLEVLAQSRQQQVAAEAQQLQWENRLSQVSHSGYTPYQDEIIQPEVVSMQHSPPYSQRVRRAPQPQIEIQEFPPGYMDT